MKMLPTAIVAFFLIDVAGCSSPPILALKGDAIGMVQADIKRQVGVYARAATQAPYWMDKDKHIHYIEKKISDFWCGNGDIDYVITSVDVELTTTRDTTTGGSINFTVPVQMITVGGKGGISKDVSDVQIIKYHLWPVQSSADELIKYYGLPSVDEVDSAPIASALLTLRNQQVYAAMRHNPSTDMAVAGPQPCFTNYDPTKTIDGAKQTYSIGITTTYDANGQLTVGLGPVSIGASGEVKSITGQTLLVSFEQRYLKEIKSALDAKMANEVRPDERPRHAPPRHPPRASKAEARAASGTGVLSEPINLDTKGLDEIMRSTDPHVVERPRK